jgi:hypothetical protein
VTTIRSVHSPRTLPIQRPAIALACGARTGVPMTLILTESAAQRHIRRPIGTGCIEILNILNRPEPEVIGYSSQEKVKRLQGRHD